MPKQTKYTVSAELSLQIKISSPKLRSAPLRDFLKCVSTNNCVSFSVPCSVDCQWNGSVQDREINW